MNKLSLGYLETKKANINLVAKSQTLGWQLTKYNIPEIWRSDKGANVKVAIIDTAMDLRHPDLSIKGGYDFVYRRNLDIYRREYPVQGHGSHVAGIVGAKNNTIGVVGVAPECSIYSCVGLGNDGTGSYAGIINAIDWCIRNKMDIISMSLGGGTDTKAFYAAIRRAYDAKIPTICAGGNSAWAGHLDYPACYNETIAVAAIAKNMKRAGFSSIGGNIDVAAPGVDILSCVPENNYAFYSGTSMATPFVTGVVALMIAKHRKHGGNTPINNVEDIREHLIKTTTDANYSGQDSFTGYGLINPKKSLDYNSGMGVINATDLMRGNISVKINHRRLPQKGKVIKPKFTRVAFARAIKRGIKRGRK